MLFKRLVFCLFVIFGYGLVEASLFETNLTSNTYEYTLANGLKLIVREDHRAPIVVTQLWYKLGSSYENNNNSGISYLLGQTIYQTSDPSNILKVGGKVKANTNKDATFYSAMIKSDKLSLSMQFQKNSIDNLNISKEALDATKNKALKSRTTIDQNYKELAKERFLATAFLTGHYQYPIIGQTDSIDMLTLAELQKWHETWYAPNNAVLVVTGDVIADQVHELVKKQFDMLSSKDLPNIQPHKSLPILGVRNIQIKLPVQVPMLYMGYNVPSINTATDKVEPYALIIATKLLGNHAQVEYAPYNMHSSIFTLIKNAADNETLADLETTMLNEINALKTQLIDTQKLKQLKEQIITEHIYSQDSLYMQAYNIGMLESCNYSWKEIDNFVKQIKEITAEQIQNVFKKYFIADHMTTAYLMADENTTDL